MIDFLRYRKIFFLISAAVLIPGVISLITWGLYPSIDFTGGALWEIKFEKIVDQFDRETVGQLGKEAVGNFELGSIQSAGENTFLIRSKPISEDEKNKIAEKLQEKFGKFSEVRFETIGPALGRELLEKTLIGVCLATSLILLYVAWRFKNKMYGICAILAVFHDTLILLGSFSLLGHFLKVEVDTLFVTAVLTTLSFSVHDTVVTYDNIRNVAKWNPKAKFSELVNLAINQTLIRNLNNSLTILFMLLALILLGGASVRWFVAALLVGTISGTYSSTFIATPLLVVWKEKFGKPI